MASTAWFLLLPTLQSLIALFIITNASRNIGYGRPPSSCNCSYRNGTYPADCGCLWVYAFGDVMENMYHYNDLTRTCVARARELNCNAFNTMQECQQKCNVFTHNLRRRKMRRTRSPSTG
uniref:Pancreatic trypsin inhibitor n=1 Tax=Rhipicephalus appendiculatus TaxID=34631 RepID=A0A131YS28_RHIAP